MIQISVVIPTCNRKHRLLSLLANLNQSTYPLLEVIVIDSGEDELAPADYAPFNNLSVQYLRSAPSVCIQRNAGVQKARGQWIFLCDDDVEVPADYVQKLMDHIQSHNKAGAVSGLFLQKVNGEWKGVYPITSTFTLWWHYIFRLSIWGGIECKSTIFTKRIINYYRQKKNHLSNAGWPIITDLSGEYSRVQVYTLGAALVKREWLLQSPYDEVLDRHGIGDNYGVSLGFPEEGIHIVNDAFVYHHRGPENRLHRPLQYYRRALALDYFMQTRKIPSHIKRRWFLWSLAGNLLVFIVVRNGIMIKPAFKSFWRIARGRNPYCSAGQQQKVVEPLL
jgi:glycosyltransferase involved in cell wall biosynthesis